MRIGKVREKGTKKLFAKTLLSTWARESLIHLAIREGPPRLWIMVSGIVTNLEVTSDKKYISRGYVPYIVYTLRGCCHSKRLYIYTSRTVEAV